MLFSTSAMLVYEISKEVEAEFIIDELINLSEF